MKSISQTLKKPEDTFRPWALWIWNLYISEDEVTRQLNAIADNGFGGVVIRPGFKMNPPYLSEEFFSLFHTALCTAQQRALRVKIAEDYSLPWCNSLSETIQTHAQLRLSHLRLIHSEDLSSKRDVNVALEPDYEHIAMAVQIKRDVLDITKTKILQIQDNTVSWKAPGTLAWRVLIVRKEFSRNSVGSFIPNIFESKAAIALKNVFADHYISRFNSFIPNTFSGFLNEMPSILPHENTIPWNDDFPSRFKHKYKTELLDFLPVLFCDALSHQLKYREKIYSFIFQTMYERFADYLESWARKSKLEQWLLCPEEKHNTTQGLSGTFAIPNDGFTMVGIQNRRGSHDNLFLLKNTSMINRLANKAKGRTTLTVVGRNKEDRCPNLQDILTEIDYNIGIGPSQVLIDGLYFNLTNYSHIKTPHSPFWYSTEWPHMKKVCEYTNIVQELLDGTTYMPTAALLFADSSTLLEYTPADAENTNKIIHSLRTAAQQLYASNTDFDVIPEKYLTDLTINADGTFSKAKKRYELLIIPDTRLLSKNVLVYVEKLLSKKGSRVIFLEGTPQGTTDDGFCEKIIQRIERLKQFKKGCCEVVTSSRLRHVLQKDDTSHPIRYTGDNGSSVFGVWGLHDAYTVYFITSTPTALEDSSIELARNGNNHFYEVDCMNEEISELSFDEEDDTVSLDCDVGTTRLILGSRAKLYRGNRLQTQDPIAQRLKTHRKYRIVLHGTWDVSARSLNPLPLPNWTLRIGVSKEFKSFSHFYETYCEIDKCPSLCYFIVRNYMRAPQIPLELFQVTVNSHPLPALSRINMVNRVSPAAGDSESAHSDPNPWMHNFFGADISEYLTKGGNRLSVRTVATFNEPESELVLFPPAIVGDFHISAGKRGLKVAATQPQSDHTSWTRKGFPFLSGITTYTHALEVPNDYTRLFLRILHTSGCVKVSVNDNVLGDFTHAPAKFDITEYCTHKRNKLQIEVMNTIENITKMNRRASGILGDVYLDVY